MIRLVEYADQEKRRYGAMVAVSRDLQKDELVLHDARAHDGQDRALRIIFSDRPIAPDIAYRNNRQDAACFCRPVKPVELRRKIA